jgi:hypothetical protein
MFAVMLERNAATKCENMRPGFQTFLDIRAALRSRNGQRLFASLRMTLQYEIAWIASDRPAATKFRQKV